MALYDKQFSEEHDFPRVARPEKVLVIASTGRCGSHMLGHALHQTGCFGFPLEYANTANLREWKQRIELSDFSKIIGEIQARRTSPNGVFGIKVHFPHLKKFGGFKGLLDHFPDAVFVHLHRKDLVKQAVFLSIARQTGVWISGQEASSDTEPVFDFEQINECLKETISHNDSWRKALVSSGSKFIELEFSQVRNDLTNSIEGIAQLLDVELPASAIPTEQVTKKQSNSRNQEWAKRFVSELKS